MAKWFSKIGSMLVHNKGPKLASVFFAVITWFAIQSAISFEAMVTDIPLTIHVDEGWAVMESSANVVDVLFRGSQEDLRYLNRDQVKVEVDVHVEPTSQGSMVIKLEPKNVQTPGTARAVAIQPDEITLKLDQEGDKQVPVKVAFQTEPPEGYELEKVICTPASVRIFGPRRHLKEIDSVQVTGIDLEGRVRSFKKLKMEIAQPSETWAARIEPPFVMVDVTIAEHSATKEVRDVPVGVLMSPLSLVKRMEVWPPKVHVTLKGRSDLLKSVERENLNVFVDCSQLQVGAEYDLPVRVTTAQGVNIAALDPATVKVTLVE